MRCLAYRRMVFERLGNEGQVNAGVKYSEAERSKSGF